LILIFFKNKPTTTLFVFIFFYLKNV